ncbi:hypothetical protein M3Y97_00161900 [Aphelenchoides bicaudatus]|nr:hypothetical protein M3Y97_00161900 [Aphelenchoides bicaudatus]
MEQTSGFFGNSTYQPIDEEMDIDLYDDTFFDTRTTAPTTVKSEKGKTKAARDPVTNQTWDTVRKRQMIARFGTMLDEIGLVYRLDGVKNLTRIQSACMVHRNQKHIDAIGVSEEVLGSVFDHRLDKVHCQKRGEQLLTKYQQYFEDFEEIYENQHQATFYDGEEDETLYQFDEHDLETSDNLVGLGGDAENQQAFQLKDELETKRLFFTEKWLSKLQNSLMLIQQVAQEKLKEYGQPNYVELNNASCLSTEEVPDSGSARCRPIEIVSRRPLQISTALQNDLTTDVFRQLNYEPKRLEDEMEVILEAMALQFESDVYGSNGNSPTDAEEPCRLAWRVISFKRFALYAIAQFIGCFLGSLLVFVHYFDAINDFDGGVRQVYGPKATAGIFATYPKDYLTLRGACFDQFITTLILAILSSALNDVKLKIPLMAQPALNGAALWSIVGAFSLNCGAALNPARDFSPRLMTFILGYGVEVFSYNNWTWFFVPITMPFFGALAGAFIYKHAIGTFLPTNLTNAK